MIFNCFKATMTFFSGKKDILKVTCMDAEEGSLLLKTSI